VSDPFHLSQPARRVPILLSIPHCGVEFPKEISAKLIPRYVEDPEDTDWFVDELYPFAADIGITVLRARFSRYVVDLNRDPASRPLYTDGRLETELVPTRSFAGEPLYAGPVPDAAEKARRVAAYYDPYHSRLKALVSDLRREFGSVLVYDAHSIRRLVPTIRPTPFPDLILGDQKGRTAGPALTRIALETLGEGGQYQIGHNDPFQGGYITRHYGRPEEGVHALQLEMSQDVYLDEEGMLDPKKTEPLRRRLRKTLEGLADEVRKLRGVGSA
jgi:N-formylglutamate deformylase